MVSALGVEVGRKIEELAKVSRRVANNAKVGTPEALIACIEDRRQIASLMVGLQADCDIMISALPDAAQLKTREMFRPIFNKLRSSMALLQAEWPVVEIARDPAGYDRARQSFNRNERAFVDWIKDMIRRG
jgi:hypothetical protein